jgi:hypothetical protein
MDLTKRNKNQNPSNRHDILRHIKKQEDTALEMKFFGKLEFKMY